jgi:hypothetical protein
MQEGVEGSSHRGEGCGLPFTAVDVLLVLDEANESTVLSEKSLQKHRAEHFPPGWQGV